MIHVLLPDRRQRPLSFYLAMEEYLAARDDRDYFFMWQVSPTVIIGRNQHLLTEVNTDYCRREGINIVRRRSGGGCVYADMNNIMFSHITTSATVTDTFSRYTAQVAALLRSLGLDARAGGRNDILIGDRKVSGNAFYHRRGRAILHGTMLYDTDLDRMLHAITPSSCKLTSKGVESVRSRVINLVEVLDMSIDLFKQRSASYLCGSSLTLDDDDVQAITAIEQSYLTDSWLYGNSPGASASVTTRIDGAGEFTVAVNVKGELIDSISISGDFFLLSDLDTTLLDRLRGVRYDREAIATVMIGIDTSTVIAGLDNEKFINLII